MADEVSDKVRDKGAMAAMDAKHVLRANPGLND
jgi:hypothetical protein